MSDTTGQGETMEQAVGLWPVGHGALTVGVGGATIGGPVLAVVRPDGEVTARTMPDDSALARAMVQQLKPTGRAPIGARVVAVYRSGAIVERVKR